jgi:predicted SprT family Zn-dependent metalloprotease
MNYTEWKIIFSLQVDYCELHNFPNFLPENGYCYRCACALEPLISRFVASTTHITRCPRCNRSWCE